MLGNLTEIKSWQISYPGIETEKSIHMFPMFPKFRKPRESASRQFPCLGNDMETSTQSFQTVLHVETRENYQVDRLCVWKRLRNHYSSFKHGKPLGNH